MDKGFVTEPGRRIGQRHEGRAEGLEGRNGAHAVEGRQFRPNTAPPIDL